MLLYVYCQPLWLIVVEMFAAIVIWAGIGLCAARKKEWLRAWKAINYTLLVLALGVILYATVLDRASSQRELWLKPFEALRRAKEQPELYRSMLMNVFLFVPLGLMLSTALPERWRAVWRFLCTVAVGLAVSVLIESVQYFCMLGTAEADDVICNTIGAALGASQIFAQKLFQKFRTD